MLLFIVAMPTKVPNPKQSDLNNWFWKAQTNDFLLTGASDQKALLSVVLNGIDKLRNLVNMENFFRGFTGTGTKIKRQDIKLQFRIHFKD